MEQTFTSWDYYQHADGTVTLERLLWILPADGGERRCLGLVESK